ncbi:Vicilin [Zostera marina]|uniref:Vicilin n=1 Tax=Zostera marina TaxID=29655 RepID=A0A0K9PTX6_ZOSMR|nr:Vicilin [Zostera marina]
MPNYWDADALLYVRRGMGNINMITSDHDKQESHGLRKGDVIRVPAGTMVYIVNNNSEILTIVALLKTTSPPGQFKEYYGAGGAVPPSFYRTFSNDLLEAAFNTDREKIEKLFEKQKEGPFLKATSKQLSGIGREGSTSTHWPFGSGSVDSPFNLHEKSPASFNGYGQLREVDRNEYRQLKDLDVMVSFLNLTMGSMMAPFYNTKSTTISLVTRGRGYIELACPHHPTGQGENDDNTLGDYRKVEADLHPGMVFVTMTGHPIIIVANEGKNLEVLTFVISPEMNKMNFLAGKNNLLNQLDDSAKILSFHQSADEVNHVLNSQDLEVFFPGPELRKQSGKHDGRKQRPIATILDLVGF